MIRQSSLSIAYKALAVALLLYALVYGLLAQIPVSPQMGQQLGQSARNILYHVPNWFAMLTLMGISLYHSIRLLLLMDPDRERKESPLRVDSRAAEAARVGVMFNVLGLVTGIIWARVSWNEVKSGLSFSAWWGWDPIQTCALIALLIYLAYYLLRNSIEDPEQKAKVSAVYNIFAFMTLIPLFFIIPRMLEGLHPTADGGAVLFKREGMNSLLRMILYPGMLGLILLGVWIYELRSRAAALRLRWLELDSEKAFAADFTAKKER